VNRKITGFEIVGKLGEGGMAAVWKARQISLDRIVAIKVLSERLTLDPTDIGMFLEEARSAAKLKHPGIIQVYDANVEDGIYYFVMEFVAGYTVGDWIRRKGKLTDTEAILVGECVADALQYAWEKEGLIHCDIKPDNVMIDEDGTVKVADLGLARTIRSVESRKVIEDIMGTPAYMSPEQAQGDPDLDCRSDIYSLGAMLYHIVTGVIPFEEFGDEDVMDLQVTDTLPDPMDLNPDVSKAMSYMIERMMAKSREYRQHSWAEVLEDLEMVKKGKLPGTTLEKHVPSTVRRSEKRTRSPTNAAIFTSTPAILKARPPAGRTRVTGGSGLTQHRRSPA